MKAVVKKVLYFGLVLCCFSTSVLAASNPDRLYEVSLLALDQSDGERQKSLREGLEKIILRISGQADLRGNASIQEALANPDAYLRQFGYVSLTDAEKTEFGKAKSGTKGHWESKPSTRLSLLAPTIRINASFSPELIKALLRRAQLPIWSSNRPSVLVWIVVEDAKGKHLLKGSDSTQGFLLQEASRRGLSVVLPMNDLNDQVTLGASRLWDLDQAAIAEASQRYGEDSILVGRVAQIASSEGQLSQWQGNWLYLLKGQSWLIESSNDELEDFLVRGIDAAVQVQVQRYGISPTSKANRVLLEISGVNGLERYADTLAFLKSLDLVRSVMVTATMSDVLHCTLEIEGDSQLLQDVIGLGHVLISDDPSTPVSPVSVVVDPASSPEQAPQNPVTDSKTTTDTPTLRYHFSAQ